MIFRTRTTIKFHVWTGVISVGFLLCAAFYIYGINEVAVHTLGIEAGKKRIAKMEEELYILEAERAHLSVGSWLEDRVRHQELSAAGPVYFLSRDSSVARLDH